MLTLITYGYIHYIQPALNKETEASMYDTSVTTQNNTFTCHVHEGE